MNRIEVKLLNPEAATEAEQMMVCAARLTQKGHKIHSMDDFMELYRKGYKLETAQNMAALPHPTIQKFGVLNVVVVGASRRFLAQITRHQNEVKFMSASLQYSDYSGNADFVVPYGILGTKREEPYLAQCKAAMREYMELVVAGIDNDEAGYLAPQSLRNVLIISATPYQWKHMIAQRTCRRNIAETRYVMLRIWEKLANQNGNLFFDCGPSCKTGVCAERNMCCGEPLTALVGGGPEAILKADFPKCV